MNTCVKCSQILAYDAKFCPCCGWQQSEPLKSKKGYTLAETFAHWKRRHYRRVGAKSISGYEYAWRKLKPLHDRKLADIDVDDYQQILDTTNLSYSVLHQIQNLINQLCDFGVMYAIIPFNFGHYLIIDAKQGAPRNIFSDEAIDNLIIYAENKGNLYWEDARITLCLIFTGLRPEELFSLRRQSINLSEKYLIGGSKTTAGKNRTVPISNVVWRYIAEWYITLKPSENDYLIQSEKSCRMRLNNWRRRKFYPLMLELNINEPSPQNGKPLIVPYSCRHTFASLCARAGMQKDILCKLIGHVDAEFTNRTYIHQQVEEYRHEIGKLDFMMSDLATQKLHQPH